MSWDKGVNKWPGPIGFAQGPGQSSSALTLKDSSSIHLSFYVVPLVYHLFTLFLLVSFGNRHRRRRTMPRHSYHSSTVSECAPGDSTVRLAIGTPTLRTNVSIMKWNGNERRDSSDKRQTFICPCSSNKLNHYSLLICLATRAFRVPEPSNSQSSNSNGLL